MAEEQIEDNKRVLVLACPCDAPYSEIAYCQNQYGRSQVDQWRVPGGPAGLLFARPYGLTRENLREYLREAKIGTVFIVGHRPCSGTRDDDWKKVYLRVVDKLQQWFIDWGYEIEVYCCISCG